ncbi:uncharacterized protein FIBRA_04720 [Fibroporia radiculosa]|uniref:VPS9 domain-containing protein n=1 Tax=Fibroporia radiculosa TaxID=599839 RepID=J4HWP4_9APHY|nr:uncharacterized protein FIBRA_04720 [Fibroporia radiculosa]CCM02617.1 predicted protein [Fibroporia radiculosa]
MPSRRDSLFPPGSIGHSSPVPRTASFETLSTHPLLSPPPPSSPAPIIADVTHAGAPRYVPYTPRQRVAPASATTGTTLHPSIGTSQQQNAFHGDATSKLQVMNLKAAAQRIGLDAASTGWAILEKLSTETDHGAEWNDIWSVLSSNKATLFLPIEPHHANDAITPEFIKDHIALCDSSTRSSSQVVTLSGLRGTLTDTALIIRSTIPPSSTRFQTLLPSTTPLSAFSALPPLPNTLIQQPTPAPPSPTSSSSSSLPLSLPQYPTYAVLSHGPALPLPPRPSVSKPPLPPRPGSRVASGSSHSASRLSNPFASFFGRSTPPASPSNPPASLHPEGNVSSSNTASTAPLPIAPSISTSPQTGGSSALGTDRASAEHVTDIPAYTLATCIDRTALGRSLSDAIIGEMRAALWEAGVPSWAVERVERFAKPLFPLTHGPAGSLDRVASAGKAGEGADSSGASKIMNGKVNRKGDVEWSISIGLPEERAESITEKFQEFYADMEETVWERLSKDERKRRKNFVQGIHFGKKNRSSENATSIRSDSDSGGETEDPVDEKDEESEEDKEHRRETRVREIMDAVERVLCTLFYDRLFLLASSDDASHDEALSSRIAAVNLLDLGLSHLGVDVGGSSKEVEAVVMECGQILAQLDTIHRTPADKAALLVSVHKIIVDGLSKLPPIGLRSEDEMLDEKTPRASTFGHNITEDEEDEDDRRDHDTTMKEEPSLQVQVSVPPSETIPSSPTIVLSPEESTAQKLLHEPSASPPDTGRTRLSPNDSSPQKPMSSRSRSSSRAPSPHATPPTPVSGDVILPLMIFAVVKANPPRLVSNLLYIQRFRRESAGGGEEGYCLINLMAVAEFLENVDLAALGLGESEKSVLSAAQLSPIPLARSVRIPGSEPTSPQVTQASLRGRVEQQVDAIAGSANKVISGVVDTSFGVLRSLLPGQSQVQGTPANATESEEPSRPGFGILRRDTGFSIASLAASLPGNRARSTTANEESGQQMVEVPSRPGSSRSMRGADGDAPASEDESADDSANEEEEGEEEEDYEHDTRSIRSFESMMSSRATRKGKRRPASGRMSLTDRLANMPGLSRLSQNQSHDGAKVRQTRPAAPRCVRADPAPPDLQQGPGSPSSRRSSLLLPAGPAAPRFDSPASSRAASPIAIRISPPNPRFLACTEDDIRVSEVGELLREYKRLVEAVRAMGGFHED